MIHELIDMSVMCIILVLLQDHIWSHCYDIFKSLFLDYTLQSAMLAIYITNIIVYKRHLDHLQAIKWRSTIYASCKCS